MAFRHTVGAGTGGDVELFVAGIAHLDGDNASRHSERPPAHEHHDSGDESPDAGCGCDIAIAHGGHGGDRPVNRRRDVGEFIVNIIFDQIHHGTHDDRHNQHE